MLVSDKARAITCDHWSISLLKSRMQSRRQVISKNSNQSASRDRAQFFPKKWSRLDLRFKRLEFANVCKCLAGISDEYENNYAYNINLNARRTGGDRERAWNDGAQAASQTRKYVTKVGR